MRLQLRPANPDDVPEIVAVAQKAFATNDIHLRCLHPESKLAREFWYSSLSEEIHDPNAHFVVVEDADATPPIFAAFAKWNRMPENMHQDAPPDDIWPKDGDVELAIHFFGKLFEMHESIMGTQAHWYLELIATKNEYQGKGAGGMLVKWGVDKADQEGWPCYLDSTPDGKALYLKHGFRNLETLTFLDGRYEQWFMLRDAKEAGESKAN
ncbi:acyl-CoA N-acyltransferase [Thozetella sp. PMI_491]|nr:acyl-CoA N-acyltransferase [Thozetella sp. PMI_491]